MISNIFKIVLLFIILQAAMVFAQSPEKTKELEGRLAVAEAQQDSLAASINNAMAETDSLSKIVTLMRQKNSLSLAERGRLDNLLKQSQALTATQENAVQQHTQISQKIETIKTELAALYAQHENQLLTELEKSPVQNSRISKELATIRARKSELAQHTTINIPSSKFDLKIDQDDMPQDIEAKATLLRDRENTFRQKAQELEKRYQAVKQETNLRKRMAEMVDDVRLFDSRDEAISSSNLAATSATDEKSRFSNDESASWFNSDDMGGISNSLDVSEANELLSFDLQSIPNFDVQDYLNELDEHKKVLLREADSLSHIADDFENQAEKLRNSLKKSPE